MMNSKRNGPKHKIRHDLDEYPWINDWFEAAIIFTALATLFGGGVLAYYILR
jgi:hypothetical protein